MANKKDKQTQILVVVLVIFAIALLSDGGTGLFAFDNPANNKEPNPSVEEWVPGDPDTSGVFKRPVGWTHTGWSHGPNWEDLVPETNIVRTGSFSAGFIDKGFDGQRDVTACDDWCRFQTSKAPIADRAIIKARYYFYPESFTRYSSNDGIRVGLMFYDGSGDLISSGGGMTLREEQFEMGAGWHEMQLEAVAPEGATHAAIQFTFATRTGNEFLSTFYVDDVWIETEFCAEDWVCDPWEYCRGGFQTRACVDNNECGLTFNKPEEGKTCQGTIHEYKQQFKDGDMGIVGMMEEIKNWRDGYITSKELEQMWLTTRYLEREEGWIYSWHRSESYMGWEDAMAVSSMLTMYETTDKAEYLDMAIEYIDWEIGNWPFEGAGWSAGERPASDRASGGNLIENWVRFAYITKRDGLSQYYAKGVEYSNFAEENFLQYWKEDTVKFTQNGIDMGCVADGNPNVEGSTWHCDRFNAMLGVHSSYLYQYLYNGDEEYKDLAVRGANFFKYKGLHLHQNEDGSFGEHYEWGYRVHSGEPDDDFDGWGTYESGHRDELHYAAYDMRAAYTFWEHDLVFDDTDMERFSNTVSHAMWNGDMADPLLYKLVSNWGIPGAGDMHYAFETGYTQGLTYYNQFDPIVKEITERIAKKLYDDGVATGSFWSDYYQCINTVEFGRICYSDTRTQPDMQLLSIANILYTRGKLGE